MVEKHAAFNQVKVSKAISQGVAAVVDVDMCMRNARNIRNAAFE